MATIMAHQGQKTEIIHDKVRRMKEIYEKFLAEMEALKREQRKVAGGIMDRIEKEKADRILKSAGN